MEIYVSQISKLFIISYHSMIKWKLMIVYCSEESISCLLKMFNSNVLCFKVSILFMCTQCGSLCNEWTTTIHCTHAEYHRYTLNYLIRMHLYTIHSDSVQFAQIWEPTKWFSDPWLFRSWSKTRKSRINDSRYINLIYPRWKYDIQSIFFEIETNNFKKSKIRSFHPDTN